MYKPLTQNIQAECLVWYFHLRIIPGTSHKLRLFWAGPCRVMKLIAPASTKIKPVYFHVGRKTGESRHIETIQGR